MQRLGRWIVGAVGGFVAYKLLRRRPRVVTEAPSEPMPESPDERAEELRAKLAESRTEPEPEEPESPEERRRHVHEEGRAAIDEMRSEEG